MHTDFAPAHRLHKVEILKQVENIKDNIFLTNMLNSLKSLIAVVNVERQIVAVNEELVKSLGFNRMEDIFGLRPGEAIHCIYSNITEGGCGTTEMCKSCGAVKAIINSIKNDETQVELCSLKVEKGNDIVELVLEVTACPVILGKEKYITLHMRDISKERLKNAMERTFFHDINNLLSALVGSSEILTMQNKRNLTLETKINSLASRVAKEIEVQRALSYAQNDTYQPDIKDYCLEDIIEELKTYSHTNDTILEVSTNLANDTIIKTDQTLLLRILTNMIKNGVEASGHENSIKLKILKDDSSIQFSVWNCTAIPKHLHKRIFQEHFSTKIGNYRGLGTHSMKIFGEKILKSKVWFTSSPDQGTTFFLELKQ